MTETATAQTLPEVEAVETPEELLAGYEAPSENAPKDLVAGRFRILLAKPLPELSKTLAQAFAVEDTEQKITNAYALVLANTMPYRMKAIEALKAANHPALPACHAAAPTPLSSPAETRMVVVLDKPEGQSLRKIMQENGSLPDRFIIDKILKPLNEAMQVLARHGINHGSLNPDTLFFGKELKIAEPLSEPSGYSQDYHYEPPERLFADANGKGSGGIEADSYAMAVLTLALSQGMLPLPPLERQAFEERILKLGSYHAFTQTIDPSEIMLDLLRGSLNDDPSERWTGEQIGAWLGGKRFNLIMPSIPRDCSRPYHFNGEDYYSYRALAHALFHHWQTARTQIAPSKLVRWMELSPNNTEAADMMAHALRLSGDDERTLSDEEVMKAIAILDPFGPMRYKEVAINIDGVGKALTDAIRSQNNAARQQIQTMLESGLPAFLTDVLEKTSNARIGNKLFRLQQLRPVLQLKSLGFGVERIMYSLNPSLTCQSPLLRGLHPTSLQDALTQLDRIAKEQMKRHSLIDAHLAAYLTAKLEIVKELRVLELAAHRDLQNDSRLVTLKLLALAQQKIKNTPLKGLAIWAASMVLPMVEKIHQKSGRAILIKEINKAAKTGIIENIAFLMFKETVFTEDRREYGRAQIAYQYHLDAIKLLKDEVQLKIRAREMGRSATVTFGYIVLGMSMYVALNPYVNL